MNYCVPDSYRDGYIFNLVKQNELKRFKNESVKSNFRDSFF